MKLFDLLFPEKEQLQVPDVIKSSSTHSMAVSSIWIHLMKKAEGDSVKLQRPIPHSLQLHIDYLQQNLVNNNLQSTFPNDYRVCLLCNACKLKADYMISNMN